MSLIQLISAGPLFYRQAKKYWLMTLVIKHSKMLILRMTISSGHHKESTSREDVMYIRKDHSDEITFRQK